MDTKHQHRPEPSPGVHHETSDVQVGPLAWIGVGLATLIIVSFLAMRGLFVFLDRQQAQEDVVPLPMMTQRPQQPPEPRLQTTPVPNRKLIADQENMQLGTYGWIDSKKGIVRIPVDQAMKLLAERGLPTRNESGRPQAASDQQVPTARQKAAGKAGE